MYVSLLRAVAVVAHAQELSGPFDELRHGGLESPPEGGWIKPVGEEGGQYKVLSRPGRGVAEWRAAGRIVPHSCGYKRIVPPDCRINQS